MSARAPGLRILAIALPFPFAIHVARGARVCRLVAWVSFLMLANGLVHVVGILTHRRYSPGVITGCFLYLPLSILFMRAVARECAVSCRMVLLAALIGGVPMFIHGYLIVFRGSRLF